MAKKGDADKVCSILTWLERHNEELFDIVKGVCADRYFYPRGGNGVTFINPNKELLAKIKTKYDDDPEQAEKYIMSLILPLCLKTSSDFNSKTTYGNKLQISFGTPTVTGSTVKFKDFSIKPSDSFRPFSSREKLMSVWELESGEPPLSGDKYEIQAERTKTGRGESTVGNRCEWAMHVMRKYLSHYATKDYDPFLSRVLTTAKYVKKTHPDTWSKVKLCLDYSPIVAFILIFEPFKSSYTIVSDDIWQIVKDAEIYNNAVDEYRRLIQSESVQFDRSGTISAISSKPIADQRTAAQEAYSAFASVVGLDASLLSWQDQFRFYMHARLCDLQTKVLDNTMYGMGIGSLFVDVMIAWPGNNYSQEACILSGTKDVRQSDNMFKLRVFINSSDFLWIPSPSITADSSEFTSYDQKFDSLLSQYGSMIGVNGMSPLIANALQVQAAINN